MNRLLAPVASLLFMGICACSDNIHTENPTPTVEDSYFSQFNEPNPFDAHFDSMPPGGIKMRINSPGVLGRVFNDSNYRHLEAATTLGIEPIADMKDIWHASRPLVRIR